MTIAYAGVTVTYKGNIEVVVPDDVTDVDGFVRDYIDDSIQYAPDDVEYLAFDDYKVDYEIEYF